MYAQLTNQEVVVPGIQAPSGDHERVKLQEKGKQDAKKGWQSVADDFGGSFGGNGKSPGSAANQTTMRKDSTAYANGATQVTLKRNI